MGLNFQSSHRFGESWGDELVNAASGVEVGDVVAEWFGVLSVAMSMTHG
jgi:hypothetical protein